jgi:hypothetical protein
MEWGTVAILIALAVGVVGFGLMVVSFALVAHEGGWVRAMRAGTGGAWPLRRRLMFAGAVLGLLFSAIVLTLFLIPGGIPWLK